VLLPPFFLSHYKSLINYIFNMKKITFLIAQLIFTGSLICQDLGNAYYL